MIVKGKKMLEDLVLKGNKTVDLSSANSTNEDPGDNGLFKVESLAKDKEEPKTALAPVSPEKTEESNTEAETNSTLSHTTLPSATPTSVDPELEQAENISSFQSEYIKSRKGLYNGARRNK
jgi:hypothetical protein